MTNCCAQAATIWGLLILVDWVGWTRWLYALDVSHGRVGGGVVLQMSLDALLALSVAFALVGYRRISGVVGLAWIGVLLAETLGRPPVLSGLDGSDVHWIAFVLIPTACYATMTVGPRASERHPSRVGWLLTALLLGGLLAPPEAPLELFQSIGLMNLLLVLAILAGFVALAVDLHRAVPFALALISFGLASWTARTVLESSTLHSHLQLGVTTLGPLVLLAGAAARIFSTRRSVVG
ncbi:MAG: hypothetical protein ACYCU0_11790 [Solirubrobacteraceae bacterium]